MRTPAGRTLPRAFPTSSSSAARRSGDQARVVRCRAHEAAFTATDTVWDVGAGTGSVSIEAALIARAGSVWAVERNATGVRLIRENADAFGCGNVHAVPGVAPEALAKLPVPDAVFVGGTRRELSHRGGGA
ncbi:MAG: precorrin-6Y C5,15-methyltransferase (decarboxylating) subunit CbiT [Collinsella sp.]